MIGQIVYFGSQLQLKSGVVIEEDAYYVTVNEVRYYADGSRAYDPTTQFSIAKNRLQ